MEAMKIIAKSIGTNARERQDLVLVAAKVAGTDKAQQADLDMIDVRNSVHTAFEQYKESNPIDEDGVAAIIQDPPANVEDI